jgi:hypothetical protein
MKLPIRKTHTTTIGVRITAPEFKKDPSSGKKIPLLCWGDESANHRRTECSRELFRAAAGQNEVGERPDGMDRLTNHQFVIHLDESGRAVGLDVIPARQYGGRVVPTDMVGVTTLKLLFQEDGSGVVRVLQRPVNTKPEDIRRVIESLDALRGKTLKIGMQPIEGNAAKIVSLNDGVVEIKLSARRSSEAVHKDILAE